MDVNLKVSGCCFLEHVLGAPALAIPTKDQGFGIIRQLGVSCKGSQTIPRIIFLAELREELLDRLAAHSSPNLTKKVNSSGPARNHLGYGEIGLSDGVLDMLDVGYTATPCDYRFDGKVSLICWVIWSEIEFLSDLDLFMDWPHSSAVIVGNKIGVGRSWVINERFHDWGRRDVFLKGAIMIELMDAEDLVLVGFEHGP